jgi:hypothetical protein
VFGKLIKTTRSFVLSLTSPVTPHAQMAQVDRGGGDCHEAAEANHIENALRWTYRDS